MHQLCRAERIILNHGRATGLRAVDIDAGGGLSFRILEDKALDIANLSFHGINMAFLAKPGIVNPDVLTPKDNEFLRTFQGGFLYTCGLSNVGAPVCVDGRYHPFHGRIGNTPADNVCLNEYWADDEYFIEVSGILREASLFGENLVQKRSITTKMGSWSFKITDTIENQGFSDEQLMLMYHMNIGYPMLDKGTRLYIPVLGSTKRDGSKIDNKAGWHMFEAPQPNKEEEVFYHYLRSNEKNETCVALYNDYNGFGLTIEYDLMELPCFTQWKSMRSGDYALGLEPGNCHPDGRIESLKKGESEILKPGQTVTKSLLVTFYIDKTTFLSTLKEYGLLV